MTTATATIFAAFALLADMDVRVNADGSWTIIDVPMRGESDPIADVRDVAFHAADMMRNDGGGKTKTPEYAAVEALHIGGSIHAENTAQKRDGGFDYTAYAAAHGGC